MRPRSPTYVKARVEHRIVSQAIVIATGVTEDGGREVLGVMVGDSETETFWSQFLRLRWSPRTSAPSTPSPPPKRSDLASTPLPTCSADSFPRSKRCCWEQRRT
ncbi:transposase [Streptomyces sp. NPDC059985]|uniref:transposase n=1 Tax=Streptomyces sp. NPDC059985 TaxID=3347025 RepID=UPI0036AA56F7